LHEKIFRETRWVKPRNSGTFFPDFPIGVNKGLWIPDLSQNKEQAKDDLLVVQSISSKKNAKKKLKYSQMK